MRSQIRGLNQASRNAHDGISLIQTTEGALNESHSILQRMRELQEEVTALIAELDRIAGNTEFNTQKLLDDISN